MKLVKQLLIAQLICLLAGSPLLNATKYEAEECSECSGQYHTERAVSGGWGTDLVQTRSGYSFDTHAPGTGFPRSWSSQFDGINENYDDYDDYYDTTISSNIDVDAYSEAICIDDNESIDNFNNFYEIDYYAAYKKPSYVDYVPYYYRHYPYYYGYRYGPFFGNSY